MSWTLEEFGCTSWLYLIPWHGLERLWINSDGFRSLPCSVKATWKDLPCPPSRCPFGCPRVTLRCISRCWGIPTVPPLLFPVPPCIQSTKEVKKSEFWKEWKAKQALWVCKALNQSELCLPTAPGRGRELQASRALRKFTSRVLVLFLVQNSWVSLTMPWTSRGGAGDPQESAAPAGSTSLQRG